ncbi:MAG TPA: hypothetical protein VER03_10755, partial [Bryobacteraceae bacterium]|nr:hypothetical protein [Bryobacteraceae bacterium]
MRRKLWVLDLALLSGVILTATVLRQRWTEMSLREETLLKQVVSWNGPPPPPAIPSVSPVTAAAYLDTVQQMLFAKDRNPTVILDPPPPPPPPPVMPPLPVSYGMLDLGSGPTAILAEKPGAAHKGYKAGDQIGAFKIVAMNHKEILFDWDGQPVRKTFAELAAAKATVMVTQSSNDAAPTLQNAPAPSPAPTTTVIGGTKAGPGADL